MSGAEILALTDGAPEHRLNVGETLIHLGESHPALYLLCEGTLEILHDGDRLARLTEPGSVVGELSFLLGTPASADVVVTEPTLVRRVDDPERLFHEVPAFGQHLAVTLARRLHRVTSLLGELHRQFADRPGTLGLLPGVVAELMGNDRPAAETGSDREPDSPY
jgi:CRP-like cAMP-binding protein